MRFVEFSEKADRARTDLLIPIRRKVNAAIRRIASAPEWGAATDSGDDIRVLNPGKLTANSGLIATLIQHGQRTFAIVYRIRSADDVVWIEDIREVFVG
jgi:hypothetical protein